MDEQNKPFDTVSIVILVLISLANDAAEVFFSLLAATGIGLAGEAIMEPINFCVDCIVTPWFFMKCGFGGPTMAQLLDDVLSAIGIPGRTVCVVFGIYVANNPGSFFGRVGQVVATVETGGEAGLVSEGAGALQVGEKAAQEAENLGGTALKAEGGAATSASTEEGSATGAARAKKAKEEELERKMQPEGERPPEEIAQKEIFEETPQNIRQEEGKAEEDRDIPRPSNLISMDDIRRNPNAAETRRNLTRPKASRDITAEDGGQNEENQPMDLAA